MNNHKLSDPPLPERDAVGERGELAAAQYSWTPLHYSDRERAESLLFPSGRSMVALPEAVDAMLEFAAQQWDRLGKYMRKHASEVAAHPQIAVQLQSISIAADERAVRLRSQIRPLQSPRAEISEASSEAPRQHIKEFKPEPI